MSKNFNLDTIFHMAFTLFGAAVTVVSIYWFRIVPSVALAASPYFFPLIVGIGMTAIAACGVISSFWSTEIFTFQALRNKRFTGILVSIIAYAVAMKPIGFLLSTALFCAFSARILGEKKLILSIVFGIALSLGFWQLFAVNLGLVLPRGLDVLIWGK